MKPSRRTLLGIIPSLIVPGATLARPFASMGPERAKPKVVLIERNPWLMVIGSDSPTFALYDDGLAIYATKDGYKSVLLTDTEMAALLNGIDVTALPALARHYDNAPLVTDQPTEILAIFDDMKPSIISVYGSIGPEWTARSVVPAKVVAAYNRLKSFVHPGARSWMPEKIEVMIWPYEYAPEKSIVWPSEWPGLDSPDTIKRRDGAYSIFIPSAKFPELKAFLAKQREKGAVEIGGKKWAASWRLPFPSERSWMNPARGVGADVE